jgi:thymidylate kinase
LINFEAHEEERALQTYSTWLKLFGLLPYYSWIIDRFHISTILYQKKHFGRQYNFDWLEEGLNNLGFHLILCTRNPESFEFALKDRLKASGNPSQYNNLSAFIEEQEIFKNLVRESSLKFLEVDMSESNLDLAADTIADWLDSTNGLYANY